MTSRKKLPDDRKLPGGEDTEAIMSRRRFFIASTLAGVGLGTVLPGCQEQRSGLPEPQPCLSVTPPPKPPPPPALPDACLSEAPDEPQVCLEVEPDPGPCLSVR